MNCQAKTRAKLLAKAPDKLVLVVSAHDGQLDAQRLRTRIPFGTPLLIVDGVGQVQEQFAGEATQQKQQHKQHHSDMRLRDIRATIIVARAVIVLCECMFLPN